MENFSTFQPNPSLAVTNDFGNSLQLIKTNNDDPESATHAFDSDGKSALWRLTEYTLYLIEKCGLIEYISHEQRIELYVNLALTLQLAGDNISIADSIPIWRALVGEHDLESVELATKAQAMLGSWLQTGTMAELTRSVLHQLAEMSSGLSSHSYYGARTYSALIANSREIHGYHATFDGKEDFRISKDLERTYSDMASLLSAEGKAATRACNELLSDLTTIKLQSSSTDIKTTLRKLVSLNCLLTSNEELISSIPQQRVVFFVQHLVGQLHDSLPSYILAEMLRCLQAALLAIKEIYGSFWERVFEFVQSMWTTEAQDEDISRIYASLRLLWSLRRMQSLECNDDLLDSWSQNRKAIAQGLVILLEKLRDSSDESHQPRRMVNELIKRHLSGLSREVEAEEETLYGILGAHSVLLQQTAFDLLHKIIPSRQEQVSFDKALSKDFEARLPEELLSLIVTAPNVAEVAEMSFTQAVPSTLQSYLLSWTLVFDHWTNASNILQADYAKSLAEGTYLSDLLNLTSAVLIGSRAKPIDASRFDIENYAADVEAPEQDFYWHVIHLYYLCLKHLPIQTKTWWRDFASRQINIAMESWTEKYFSKLIITSDLNAVKEWAPSQLQDDHPLTVKVSPSTREISASIPVDEQNMSIAIRLPPSYPLARAEVEGTHRVAVPEKKWVSWIRNAQGQLTIAGEGSGGGSALIDCLIAWRKNVSAAMKGQSECAICYSVVGADRSLPSKVCKTCKNKFHGSCLFRCKFSSPEFWMPDLLSFYIFADF